MTPTARAPRPARKSRPAIFEPLEHRRLLHGGSHGLAPIWYDGGVIDDDTVPVVSVPANTASARSSDAVANAANGLPDLHSLPNAPAAIYLDFDGDAATNTDPYDEDGNPSTFNASEAANITKAWTDISTYYAMFNVDVTTVKPTKPFAWLVAGNNINGGYSGVGAFPDNNRNRPSSFNNSGDARNRTSGLAHELGHNFGLNHIADFDTDGNLVNEYSSGPDDLHGPIMGVDFARSVHKWTIGHPSNSPSDVQDDMAVIAGKIRRYDTGGDGYRPDDVGGTLATARALTASNGTYAASGIIERLADVDTYAFQSTGGSVSLSAQPNGRSGLDAKLTVLRPDGSIVAVADSAANGQQLSLDLPAGTYYAAVSGHGNAGDAGQYNLTINAPTLPAGYATSDVGNPGRPGAAGFNAATGAFTVTGSGSDIYGQSDQFRFAYQKLTGDGSITARVDGLTASQFNAKAGVMIRESLAANSRHALVEATPGLGVEFVRRAATGGASDSTRSGDFAYPVYVRIDRTGSTLRASRSTDGVNFTPIGSATISMAQTVYIGLAVSSADNGQTATATFSNVRTTGNVTSAAAATPTFNGLASPANLAVSVGTGTGLNATWDRVAGAVGYALERSADGAAFSRIATLNSAQSTYADANLAGSHRYFYRVGALDAAGAASAPSAVASAVNRPSAVRNLALTKFPNANGTQVILNWSDTDGETGYRIERATDGVTFAPIGNVGANVPSFTATGLGGNTAYQFRVVPLSNLGDGDSATVARYLPPVTGLRFTGVQPTRFSLAWTDVAGETGYRIDRSTDGETFAPYATLGAGATTFDDTGVAPLGEYFYRVTATTATETGATSATIFAAGPAAASLPAGWASADLGNVGGAGTSGYGPADGGTFTVIGSGADIWNTADEFQFASRTLTGDGQIVARLTAQQNTDFYAKAGLMVRGGLAPDAALRRSWTWATCAASGPTPTPSWPMRKAPSGPWWATATFWLPRKGCCNTTPAKWPLPRPLPLLPPPRCRPPGRRATTCASACCATRPPCWAWASSRFARWWPCSATGCCPTTRPRPTTAWCSSRKKPLASGLPCCACPGPIQCAGPTTRS